MRHLLRSIKDRLVPLWKIADEVARRKAVGTVETELEELRHIFAILVLGSFIGMPSPPMQLSLELMPLMEKDFLLMLSKIDTANEPLSQLFSTLDIG